MFFGFGSWAKQRTRDTRCIPNTFRHAVVASKYETLEIGNQLGANCALLEHQLELGTNSFPICLYLRVYSF